MKAAIHQSYFLPWLGYFSKLAFSDIFVVLDNVLFRKRHYFDRTRIVNMHGEIRWLSLPVGQNFGKKCNEVYVSPPDKNYAKKIIRTIELSYAKARYYDVEWPGLRDILTKPLLDHTNMVKVNIAIIKNIIRYLNLRKPEIYFASELINSCNEQTNPTKRIIAICRAVGIDSVIFGGGMSLKVHDWQSIINNGISVYRQDYIQNHPFYEQSRRKRAGFQKGLTIIDAILNVGKKRATEFLIGNRYSPIKLDNI